MKFLNVKINYYEQSVFLEKVKNNYFLIYLIRQQESLLQIQC
jgi:hypothetical protein